MAKLARVSPSIPRDFTEEFLRLEAHSKYLKGKDKSHISYAPQYFGFIGATLALGATTLRFAFTNEFSLACLISDLFCGIALGGTAGLLTSNYLKAKLIEAQQSLNDKIISITHEKLNLSC